MAVGQLLEARDSRARSKALLLTSHSRQSALNTPRVSLPAEFTLGRIVAVQGPRVCVHMLGTDDMHDQWFLCDSDDIRPVGYVSPNKSQSPLHPPQAFRGDPAHYSRFVARAKEKYPVAPSDAFKPSPKAPQKNMFVIGDKIEAVDLSYPAFICPATVREMAGNYLRVGFDGWREGFDYWTRYDSRDIFPSGWCALVGHELQSPGAHEQSRARKSNSSTSSKVSTLHQSKKDEPSTSVKTEDASIHSISPQRSTASSRESKRKKSRKRKSSSPLQKILPPDMSSSLKISPTSTEDLIFKDDSNKKKKSSHKEKRKKNACLKLKLEKSRICLPSIHNTTPIEQSHISSADINPLLSKPVNHHSSLITTENPSSNAQSLSLEHDNLIIDSLSTSQPKSVVSLLSELTRCHTELRATSAQNRLCLNSNEINSHQSQWSKASPSAASSLSPVGNSSQSRYGGDGVAPSTKSLTSSDVASRDLYVLSDGCKLPDDPVTWSVDDVYRYLMDREPPFCTIAMTLRDADVDGMALLLMKIDTLTKFLQIKLGPALKLKNLIQDLSRNASEILPDLSHS